MRSDLPDCSRSIAIGEQWIKGAEAELAGKPVGWIDVIATYSYIHGRVTRSDVATSGIPVGSKLPEAAPNSASLFAKVALTPLGLPRFCAVVAQAAGAARRGATSRAPAAGSRRLTTRVDPPSGP